MPLPFTQSEFFDVMAAYNRAVWPAQFALEFSAVAVVWLAFRRVASAGVWVSAILALLWTWTGVAYHWAFFAAINRAAWVFGSICLAGAVAFAWFGVVQRSIKVSFKPGKRGLFGWVLIAFALVVYPALGVLVGHHYPASPTFGLPCPTTIFTVGVLLLTTPDTPRWVFVVPVIWSAIGASAAFLLGVYQDLGLVVSGLAAAWAMFSDARSGPPELPASR
jgi:hypothetical protein